MAYHYIRDGESGDGSSWSSAWDDLPTTFVRGDTYYVADGTYGTHTFSTAVSGTTRITVKKATASDHGTETGWNSAYGDGQATFGALTFSTGYYVMDGVTGGGPGSWDSGFGFRVYSSSTGGYVITISDGADNITLSHIDNEGAGRDIAGYATNLICYGDYVTTSYCRFYNAFKGCFNIISANHVTIEYCKLGPNGDHTTYDVGNTYHGYGAGSSYTISDVTVRFNLFEDISETGYWSSTNLTTGDSITNLRIYGNIFFETQTLTGPELQSNIINIGREYTVTGFAYHHNVIAHMSALSNAGVYGYPGITDGGGNVAYNNLWYDNVSNSLTFPSWLAHDYNYFNANRTSGGTALEPTETHRQIATGVPFTDMTNRDFSLVAATNNGVALFSPYTTDMLGETRGADGVWDRGALEFDSGGTTALAHDGERRYWRIRVRDPNGITSGWSFVTAYFDMAITATAAIVLPGVVPVGTAGNAATATGAVTLGGVEVNGVAEVNTSRIASGAVTLGAVTVSGVAHREITAAGAVTLGGVTLDSVTLLAPITLWCEGVTNPINVTDLLPEFSAIVSTLGANITEVRIRVSAKDDADFSETLSWDSGWLTLATPVAAGQRTEDIEYAQG